MSIVFDAVEDTYGIGINGGPVSHGYICGSWDTRGIRESVENWLSEEWQEDVRLFTAGEKKGEVEMNEEERFEELAESFATHVDTCGLNDPHSLKSCLWWGRENGLDDKEVRRFHEWWTE